MILVETKCLIRYILIFGIINLLCNCIVLDKQIYHRRVQKEPSWGTSRYVLRYPEVLIDNINGSVPTVITCIRCQDLQKLSERRNSVCKVLSGGVGHTFVTMLIMSQPNTGYDYDVKIMGH